MVVRIGNTALKIQVPLRREEERQSHPFRPERRARPRRRRRLYRTTRRIVDIVISALALAVFGLMLPFIALAIKLDSPGPVFYRQWRVGMNRRRRRNGYDGPERRRVVQPGAPIRLLKLRTMRVDAERDGPRLASDNDDRITRVGRFLRVTRLDEVPQFWNVLKGEMSLIGPRPERLVFVNQYDRLIPGYTTRLQTMPGITGLAQVRNGYDEDLESVRRKVQLDRLYIRRAGWRLDLKILLETIRVVLTGEGAR